jgi:hypothetical protein
MQEFYQKLSNPAVTWVDQPKHMGLGEAYVTKVADQGVRIESLKT